MGETALEIANLQVRNLLETWDDDTDLAGAMIVTIVDRDSLEVEVRKCGTVPDFSSEQLKSNLLSAAAPPETAWTCEPEGLGYPISFQDNLLGLCILFPSRDIHPLSRWEQEVASLALQLGAVDAVEQGTPPSLESLASEIPERIETSGSEDSRKLHWEDSKTRVQVPVQEELACHLILDTLPLF